MIPTCVGFVKSFATKPPAGDALDSTKPADDPNGSTSDAEFWWLISGTMLAILGNIFSLIPLLKLTRQSLAYQVAWALIVISCLLGITAITVYPFVNKAWSSLLTTMSACFANAAVFISTQHVSNEDEGPWKDHATPHRVGMPAEGSSDPRRAPLKVDQGSTSTSSSVDVSGPSHMQQRFGRGSRST